MSEEALSDNEALVIELAKFRYDVVRPQYIAESRAWAVAQGLVKLLPKRQTEGEHPVVKAMAYEWHKITALLMHMRGTKTVEINMGIVEAFAKDNLCIVADTRGGKLIIRLVTDGEAEKLMKEETSGN